MESTRERSEFLGRCRKVIEYMRLQMYYRHAKRNGISVIPEMEKGFAEEAKSYAEKSMLNI